MVMWFRIGVGAATVAALTAIYARAAPSPEPKPKEKVGVRGLIERITPAAGAQAQRGTLGQVFVAGKRQPDTETDQAVAIVTRTTRLLRVEEGKRRPIRFQDLQKGQQVEVRFQPGPRILIYPLRAPATEIVVLAAPGAKKT